MATANFQRILLKVPINFRKKLVKIIKDSPSGITFHELALCIQSKHNLNIDLYSSNNFDVFLEVTDEDNQRVFNTSPVKHTEHELAEFKDLLNEIDFTDELDDSFDPLPNPDLSMKYVETIISVEKYVEPEITKMCDKNFFDRWPWKVGDIHPVFMGHIYDPSKFWISLCRVEKFQEMLWDFYTIKAVDFKMKWSEVSIGSHCVVLISDDEDEQYYRGRIVRRDFQDPTYFKVFLYDFGMVSKVNILQMFHLHKWFENFPHFVVRAMLTKLSTVDEEMWPSKCVTRFTELTKNESLVAEIVSIHERRKLLEIALFTSEGSSISYRLVQEGFAKVTWQPIPEEIAENRPKYRYKAKRKFSYLMPPFEMIERGMTPSKVELFEELKKKVPWDYVFPDFYQYDESEDDSSET